MARQMILGLHFGNGYGSQPGAWRMRGVDPRSYTSFDNQVRYAQAAERGKIQFLFVPDFPAIKGYIAREPPQITIDPMLTLAAVARETERIGLVATGSTTFNEPYNQARQFKALDLTSRGRAGWNAVPTSDPLAAANYGRELPPRDEKYERLHESVLLVQALWGSWQEDAWIHDQACRAAVFHRDYVGNTLRDQNIAAAAANAGKHEILRPRAVLLADKKLERSSRRAVARTSSRERASSSAASLRPPRRRRRLAISMSSSVSRSRPPTRTSPCSMRAS